MVLRQVVATNAKAIRLKKGLSQVDLANETGLTVRYISRLENSAQNLTLDVIERLAQGLGCSPQELLGDSPDDFLNESIKNLDQTIKFLQSLKSRMKK